MSEHTHRLNMSCAFGHGQCTCSAVLPNFPSPWDLCCWSSMGTPVLPLLYINNMFTYMTWCSVFAELFLNVLGRGGLPGRIKILRSHILLQVFVSLANLTLNPVGKKHSFLVIFLLPLASSWVQMCLTFKLIPHPHKLPQLAHIIIPTSHTFYWIWNKCLRNCFQSFQSLKWSTVLSVSSELSWSSNLSSYFF